MRALASALSPPSSPRRAPWKPFMSRKLFVANFPFSTTVEELQSLFGAHGNVVYAKIATDHESGRSRGFGFVEMESAEQAEAVIRELDGFQLGGRPLAVRIAEERPGGRGPGGPRGPRPPRPEGGYGERGGYADRGGYGERSERGGYGPRGPGGGGRGPGGGGMGYPPRGPRGPRSH
jgi:RNA recognition motif-containing protein